MADLLIEVNFSFPGNGVVKLHRKQFRPSFESTF